MKSEETQIIETLLSKEFTFSRKKAALKRAGELLEETYILNLPPDKKLVVGLKQISLHEDLNASLKATTNRLLKKYSIQ